jgi:hypothetical protein
MKLEILAVFVGSIIVAGSAAVTFGWGEHAASRIIETQTMFIRHTATELQRRTAEKNAKIYYAHLTPDKKAHLKAKKIRYILVPTVKTAETSPKAKEVRMTWDTQSESLVDKYVYEFEIPPAVGTVAMVGGHTAEYAGQH